MAAEAVEHVAKAATQSTGMGSEVVLFLILTSLVAAISLYEYFSSVSWQQVTSSHRNDIVFKDLNKKYGAYEIRQNYNRNLILIILGVILFLGLLYGGKLVYSKFSTSNDQEDLQLQQTMLQEYIQPDEEEEKPIEEEKPKEEPVQQEDQQQFLPPKVTDTHVDTPPPVNTELEKSNVSDKTVKGNTDFSSNITPPPPPAPPVVHKDPPIERVVDEPAQFPGGTSALIKYLSNNIQYPDIARELNLSGKSIIQFVVNTDGSIQNVKVVRGMRDCKECDDEAVKVIKKMPHWTPGDRKSVV